MNVQIVRVADNLPGITMARPEGTIRHTEVNSRTVHGNPNVSRNTGSSTAFVTSSISGRTKPQRWSRESPMRVDWI